MAAVPCAFCERPVDIDKTGVYSKHDCWTEKRQAGGANSMTLAGPARDWAHSDCMDIAIRERASSGWKAPEIKYQVPCFFCQEPVDAGSPGHYTRHVAWSQHRAQGGANQAAFPSEPLGWAHKACVKMTKKEGVVNWGGESLF